MHSRKMHTTRFNGHLYGGVPKGVFGVCVCPGGCTPPVDRVTDRQVKKHYLPTTSFAGGKNYVPISSIFDSTQLR